MDPEIEFTYEGKRYSAPLAACELNRIVLPDGRVLKAESWLESLPPQPVGLKEIAHLFVSSSLGEIALMMNGVIATLEQ